MKSLRPCTTARAESPVISAVIDGKVLDFSAIFQFALIFDHFPEMGREKSGTFFGSAAP